MALSREELDREKAALIAEIYAAFEGVSREGGVSWSESRSLDCPPPAEPEPAAARAMDKDTTWTQLVDDPSWRADMGIGGFAFLDAIGWRYYLPAAMMRKLNGGDTFLDGNLHLEEKVDYRSIREWQLDNWSLLDRRQRLCVKRFLEWCIAEALVSDDLIAAHFWREPYESYWQSVE